ncbi:uncharacterized protein I206_104198 [Kwoniella pini CBS 10737]|uniref:WSC domain-containing protein n=1 Tax=Kwoniella pini CBS 10737 TaxID=1296096 RepID=A0A1B9I2D6_9TREE|nr:uncharacterized protein I206_04227 [Kwoniella pini CBS 10737]OCF49703.1 hypothetical protein I206_04227 [Kwoniella pini CBS 10737]
MHTFSILLQSLAVILLLPLSIAAPAPDSIFLQTSSTFKPLGCSTTFHPTSILRQVPSPFACFSRCSEKQIAAYSQLQSGVLCACGEQDMISEISIEKCRDNTWYLFTNSELSSTKTTTSDDVEETTTLKIESNKLKKRNRLMPFMFMRKKAAEKRSNSNFQ